MVNRSQADVLISAAIAGDEMPVQELIIVLGIIAILARNIISDILVGVRLQLSALIEHRHGIMRDVVQECVRGTNRAETAIQIRNDNRLNNTVDDCGADGHIVSRIGYVIITYVDDNLGKAVIPWDELPIGIGPQERNVENIHIAQLNSE